MNKIYKYLVNPDSEFIQLPFKAEVLTFGVQGTKCYLWAKVDTTTNLMETRRFLVIGTGQNIEPDNVEFINTFFVSGFVFHAFEIKDEE